MELKDNWEAVRTDLRQARTQTHTKELAERVVHQYEEAQALYKIMFLMPTAKDLAALMRIDLLDLNDFYMSCYKIHHGASTREEPVWLYLYGPPNKGKTFVTNQLCRSLFEHYNKDKKYTPADRYEVKPANDFMDGYNAQFAVTIDEHLQSKLEDDRRNQALQIISFVNSNPCPLIMASLEDKGKHSFISKFVITTTNAQGIPDNLGLSDVTAYLRRRSIVAELIEREGDNYMFKIKDPLDDSFVKKTNLPGLFKMMIEQRKLKIKEAQIAVSFPLMTAPSDSDDSDDDSSVPTGVDGLPVYESDQDESTDDKFLRFLKMFGHKWHVPIYKKTLQGVDCIPAGCLYVPMEQNDYLHLEIDLPIKYFSVPQEEDEPDDYDSVKFCWTNRDQCTDFFFMRGSVTCYVNVISDDGFLCVTDGKKSFTEATFMSIHRVLDRFALEQEGWFDWWKTKPKNAVVPADPTDLVTDQVYLTSWKANCVLYPDIAQKFFDEKLLRFVDMETMSTAKFLTKGPITQKYSFMERLAMSVLLKMPQIIVTIDEVAYTDYLADQPNSVQDQVRLIRNMAAASAGKKEDTEKVNFKMAWYDAAAGWFGRMQKDWMELTKVKQWAIVGISGFLIGVVIALVRSMVNMMKESGLAVDQESDMKELASFQKKAFRRRPPKGVKRTLMVKQEDMKVESVLFKISDNIDYIEVHYPNGKNYSSHCTWLRGYEGVTASHLFKHGTPSHVIFAYYNESVPHMVPFSQIKIKYLENRDLVIFKAMGTRLAKDITGFLPRKGKKLVPGTLGMGRVELDDHFNTVVLRSSGSMQEYAGESRGENIVNLQDCYKIMIEGGAGKCGLPYVLYNNHTDHTIAGFHVAGSTAEPFSVAAPLFLEDLFPKDDKVEQQEWIMADVLLPDFEDVLKMKPKATELKFEGCTGIAPPGMKMVGKTNHVFSGPTKTQFRPSLLQTDPNCPFELTEAPAKLCSFINEEGVRVDPMALCFKKLALKKVVPPMPEFEASSTYDGIIPMGAPVERIRKLTLLEAINGIPSWSNFHSIDMTTSAGIGFLKYGFQRKDLFNLVEGVWYPCPLIERMVERMIKQLERGEVPVCLCQGLLKDEKRPLDRVKLGKSRLFYAADVVHLIVSRIYMGGLISACEYAPTLGDINIGLNPFSQQWRALSQKFFYYGKEGYFGNDIEGWDINFQPWFPYYFVKNLVLRFNLKYDFWRGMLGMMLSSVHPYVVIGAYVFLMEVMASGSLATGFINSCFNSAAHRAMFKREVNLPYDEFVKSGFYGDDNGNGVHPSIRHLWNGKKVAEYRLKYMGWKTTAADKSDDVQEFDLGDNAVYLQRRFREENGHVYPALTKRVIESMVMWYREGDNPPQIQQTINIHTALRESFFHGREYFEKNLKILSPYLSRLGSSQSFPDTYDDLESAFFLDV